MSNLHYYTLRDLKRITKGNNLAVVAFSAIFAILIFVSARIFITDGRADVFLDFQPQAALL